MIRLTSRATILITLDGNHLRITDAGVFLLAGPVEPRHVGCARPSRPAGGRVIAACLFLRVILKFMPVLCIGQGLDGVAPTSVRTVRTATRLFFVTSHTLPRPYAVAVRWHDER